MHTAPLRTMLSALFFIVSVTVLEANIIRVPADFPTIQEAISEAVDGDTVLVAPGIYAGEGNRDINFLGRAILVTSESGPSVTVIDCEGSESDPHRGFNFKDGEGSSSVLRGFTIESGYSPAGGGIRCSKSSPTITGNLFLGNDAYYGGGIYCVESSPIVIENTFRYNTADFYNGGYGGGIMCVSAHPVIESNTFSTNFAGGEDWYGTHQFSDTGGDAIGTCISFPEAMDDLSGLLWERDLPAVCGAGIGCYRSSPLIGNNVITDNWSIGNPGAEAFGAGIGLFDSSPTITGNTLAGNWVYVERGRAYGGGIYCEDSSPLILNNTIVENHTEGAGAGITTAGDGLPIVRNTILWGNGGVFPPREIYRVPGSQILLEYCAVDSGYPGTRNIDANPRFIDPENRDYRLLADSPCIEAGHPETPTPPRGGDRIDVGAFEYEYPEFPPLQLTFWNTPDSIYSGETVRWNFRVENLTGEEVNFDGWIAVNGPVNVVTDSLLSISIPAESILVGNVRIRIPIGCPLGLYSMKGFVGMMHEELWDGEVFDNWVLEGKGEI